MSLSVPVCLKMTSLTPFFQPKKYSRTNFKRSFSNRWTCPWSGKASIRHKSLPPCSARKLMWNRKCLSSLQQHQVRVANVGNVSFGLTIPLKTNVVLLRGGGGDKILMRVTCGVWIIIWMFGCCCCCFFFLSFFSKDDGFVYVLHGWLMHRHQCDWWRADDPNIPSQERSWGTTLTFADYLKWQIWMMYRAQCCLMILHSINQAAGFLFTCSVFAQSARGMLKIPLVFICGYKYCTCFGCWMFWNLNCAWLGFLW